MALKVSEINWLLLGVLARGELQYMEYKYAILLFTYGPCQISWQLFSKTVNLLFLIYSSAVRLGWFQPKPPNMVKISAQSERKYAVLAINQ